MAEEEDGAILLAVVLIVELSSVTQTDVWHYGLMRCFQPQVAACCNIWLRMRCYLGKKELLDGQAGVVGLAW